MKPSQAEGDRETVDAALEEHGLDAGSGEQAADRRDTAPGDRPSQAEGDRATVDGDLRERGARP